MAERTFFYCALCDKTGMENELLRGNPDMHIFSCPMGHRFTYEQLQSSGARKIPLVVQEKPGPSDLRCDLWVNGEVLSRFKQRYPSQANATLNAVLNELADGDCIIISGGHARELKGLGIKTSADMVSNAKERQRLAAENEDFANKINFFSKMMKGAGVSEEESVL